MREKILDAIGCANEEESRAYLRAAIERRKKFLNGGDGIYREFTKEQVEHMETLVKRAKEMEEEEIVCG